MANKLSLYEQYIRGGSWRCKESPTGAHYWIIDTKSKGVCKHCKMVRQFVSSWVAMEEHMYRGKDGKNKHEPKKIT